MGLAEACDAAVAERRAMFDANGGVPAEARVLVTADIAGFTSGFLAGWSAAKEDSDG